MGKSSFNFSRRPQEVNIVDTVVATSIFRGSLEFETILLFIVRSRSDGDTQKGPVSKAKTKPQQFIFSTVKNCKKLVQ